MAKSEKQKRKEYYQEYWRKRSLEYEDEKRGPYYVKYRTHSTPKFDWITKTFRKESEAHEFKEQLRKSDRGAEIYIRSREALDNARMRKHWREQEEKQKKRIENRNICTFIWDMLCGILFSLLITSCGASLILLAWFLVYGDNGGGPGILIMSFMVGFAPISLIFGMVVFIGGIFTLISNVCMVIVSYMNKEPIEYHDVFGC